MQSCKCVVLAFCKETDDHIGFLTLCPPVRSLSSRRFVRALRRGYCKGGYEIQAVWKTSGGFSDAGRAASLLRPPSPVQARPAARLSESGEEVSAGGRTQQPSEKKRSGGTSVANRSVPRIVRGRIDRAGSGRTAGGTQRQDEVYDVSRAFRSARCSRRACGMQTRESALGEGRSPSPLQLERSGSHSMTRCM